VQISNHHCCSISGRLVRDIPALRFRYQAFEMVKDGPSCSNVLARQKEGGQVGMRPLLCVGCCTGRGISRVCACRWRGGGLCSENACEVSLKFGEVQAVSCSIGATRKMTMFFLLGGLSLASRLPDTRHLTGTSSHIINIIRV